MRARGTSLGTIGCLAIFIATMPSGVTESVAELQARFDRESNAVRKAKLLEKLGDAQFEVARTAGKAGDHNTVGATLEKYRDNARAALIAMDKELLEMLFPRRPSDQHATSPPAEKKP